MHVPLGELKRCMPGFSSFFSARGNGLLKIRNGVYGFDNQHIPALLAQYITDQVLADFPHMNLFYGKPENEWVPILQQLITTIST